VRGSTHRPQPCDRNDQPARGCNEPSSADTKRALTFILVGTRYRMCGRRCCAVHQLAAPWAPHGIRSRCVTESAPNLLLLLLIPLAVLVGAYWLARRWDRPPRSSFCEPTTRRSRRCLQGTRSWIASESVWPKRTRPACRRLGTFPNTGAPPSVTARPSYSTSRGSSRKVRQLAWRPGR